MKNLLLIVLLFMTIGFGWHFYGETLNGRVDIEGFMNEPLFIGKNALRVDDQAVEDSVVIKLVNISQKGYVVLQNDQDGPGDVIGASALLDSGTHGALEIILNEKLNNGFVFVSLYRDDGSGVFNIENDIPIRGPSLSPVQVKFFLESAPDSDIKQLKAVHVQEVAEEEVIQNVFKEEVLRVQVQ